ncbi:temperature dependent protein affecting M2 dsRNA replication-domain-containing protein [Mrakia frigida]|uniref:Mkt1p n=1 Tax=Mrakia frigida TaxID=29902 RepID=UPI003FCC0473
MIRNFEAYLTERGLIQTCPLAALSDTRLGIDLPQYLRHLLSSPLTREPLTATTGGLPLMLTSLVEGDLRSLEKLHIKPVFVCPGLPLAKRPPGKGGVDTPRESAMKREAWENYEHGRVDEAVRILEGTTWTEQRDLFRLVLRIFRHRSVEFIVAPYLTSAQLIYLQKHPKGYIHSVYASSEALLYTNQLDKLILAIDLPNSTMSFVTKPSILKDLGLTEDQFLDVGLLAGSDFTPTFHPLAQGGWKAVVETVKGYKTGIGAINAFPGDGPSKEMYYSDLFMRTRCAIKFSLVLTAEEGRCTPLPLALTSSSSGSGAQPQPIQTAADVPSDLHDIFSHRLPDEVYFHICRGLISPQLVGWLSSGMIIEQPPLDNGESTEYRRFIKEVITEGSTAPRCTALGLISSSLNKYWPKTNVVTSFELELTSSPSFPSQAAFYYFDAPPVNNPRQPPFSGHHVPHSGTQTSSLIDRCLTWHVPCIVVEDELRRQNSSTIDFALCLTATSEEKYACRTRKPDPPVGTDLRPLEKKDEIVANVIWRFLDLRGFLKPNHTHASLAQALQAGVKAARVNDKFQEPLFLALELTRAGVLHGDLWSGRAWSGGPSFGTGESRRPLSFSQQWSGPLSRELLVFNSFLKSLSRSLRHLLEAVSLHMLLRNDARRIRDDFLDIALSLPFQTDTSTAFGILAKVYLDGVIMIHGDHVKEGEDATEAKEAALELVENTFVGVKNPKLEVERGFRFWDALLVAIRSLSSSQVGKPPNAIDIQKHVTEQFEAADAWLRPMRP